MTSAEILDSVIRKIILPHYPMLDDVEVSDVVPFLTYFSEDILDERLRNRIGAETRNMYQMIGGVANELTIYFKDNQ